MVMQHGHPYTPVEPEGQLQTINILDLLILGEIMRRSL